MSKVTFTKTTTTRTSEICGNITTIEVCVYDHPFEGYDRLIAQTTVIRRELFPEYQKCFRPEVSIETQKASGGYPFDFTSGHFYLSNGIDIETYRGIDKTVK